MQALDSAKLLSERDPDGSASRAYYAAFYSVCAHFALEGKTFAKHSAVRASVHNDLVKSGLWEEELGAAYSYLMRLRYAGDYGGFVHVSAGDSAKAVQLASRILEAVHKLHPDVFSMD